MFDSDVLQQPRPQSLCQDKAGDDDFVYRDAHIDTTTVRYKGLVFSQQLSRDLGHGLKLAWTIQVHAAIKFNDHGLGLKWEVTLISESSTVTFW